MKSQWLNSPNRWKDSFTVAFAILAIVETFFAISAISLDNICGMYNWITKFLLVLGLFLFIVIVAFIIKYHKTKKGISLNIRGIKVNIRQGDIFKAKGWKVIAFNEFFDTTVDDVVIAHNTLNGIFIDNHIQNLSELQNKITNETDDNTNYKRRICNNRAVYPLGRIITYKDFMLLAFTHFDNNQAHLTQKDYEDCLRVMWTEISRTYANKPIFIPLLGSGITRFDGTPHKSTFDLLKCMLCTLRTSGANINQPITILLTEETIQDINIYEIKGVK
ncbi:MAG: DUF6430 domain-containing protein [Dysgonamonadaceae bacterium]|jgi:hypothetical protein|nr:DUF6430 domain-containing protein [Dysgonamonadaceae bacterium]